MKNPNNKPTMVILRSLALGDFLTGLPALRALAKAFPEHHRILTCPTWLKPLVEYTNAADEIIDGAFLENKKFHVPTDLQDRIKLEQAQLNGLKVNQRPDIAVNLRGQRTALHKALLKLNPCKYIGYHNPEIPETKNSPIWQQDEYEVEKWCRLLNESNIPASSQDLYINPPPFLFEEKFKGGTIIHPGAGSPSRYWPVERWAEVTLKETKKGKKVILTGNKAEIEIVKKVAELAGLDKRTIFAGQTNIMELCSLVAFAEKVICTNTGISHIATAFKTPSITIFGPERPGRFGPPPDSKTNHSLWAGILGDTYGNTVHSGLLKITVEDVVNEINLIKKE